MRISVNSFQNCVYAQQTFLSFGPIQALYLRGKNPLAALRMVNML